jgi:hypothetical protein
MFDIELKIKTIPQVVELSKIELLNIIDGWSISKLEGMWKGVSEESVELQIVCDVDKSKEIVKIILSNAKKLNQDSIMVGNTFISCS